MLKIKTSVKAGGFQKVSGEGTCGRAGLAAPDKRKAGEMCRVMGTWDIARLAGGASISGRGYGCRIIHPDGRFSGASICNT